MSCPLTPACMVDSGTLVVEGVKELHGASHAVLPDRIETGTYAIAAAIAGGEIELTSTSLALIGALVPLLRSAGAEVEPTSFGIRVVRDGHNMRATEATTEFTVGLSAPSCAVFLTTCTMLPPTESPSGVSPVSSR